MRSTTLAVALAGFSASLSNAISVPRLGRSSLAKQDAGDLGLPADGLTTNCIAIGFLPSEGDSASPRYSMAQINSRLGAKSAMVGWYAQISSSSFDGSQLLAVKDDIVSSGAVFVASVMPSVNFNEITTDVANQVAAVMKKFTDENVVVWLRFAHEMNWYQSDGTYKGTQEDFITAWKNIYNANCKSNPKVKCFWSPNQAGSMDDLQPWWPGPDYVDVVGIDCYPKSGQDTTGGDLFGQLYGDFYNTFSKPYNLPFAIGETGAGDGQKEGWLKQLVSQDKSKYPNYVGMSWFEFDKEADFRIVMTDDSTLQQTKAILLSGGSDNCPGGGGSTNGTGTAQPSGAVQSSLVTQPSATTTVKSTGIKISEEHAAETGSCNWGCWGWDCSADVPCQQPYTCKGGYCK